MEGRFLAARSEDGYVSSPARGLRAEPEALSEADQQAVTELARRRALDDRIRRRQATREEMERERQWHLARVRYLDRHIRRLRQRPV